MTMTAVQTEIEYRNAIFNAASDAEKRVLVAEDVLALIEAGVITPRKGAWLRISDYVIADNRLFAQTMLMRQLHPDGQEQCTACAIGALFVSCALFEARVSVSALQAETRTGLYTPLGQDHPRFKTVTLGQFFSGHQLRLIEEAFEIGSPGIGSRSPHREMFKRARLFGSQFHAPKERLVAIMQNIIDNDGEFVPPPTTEDVE